MADMESGRRGISRRKAIIGAALGMAAVPLVASCGAVQQAQQQRQDNTAKAGSGAAAPAVDEIVYWNQATPDPNLKALTGASSIDDLQERNAVQVWNDSHLDVKVKLENSPWAGYNEKVKLALAAGTPPDVAWGGVNYIQGWDPEGRVPKLSLSIPDNVMTDEDKKSYGQNILDAITRDGKYWTWPTYKYIYGGTHMLNTTYLTETGRDVNKLANDGWTWDDFRDCLKAVKAKHPDVMPYAAGLKNLGQVFWGEFGPTAWGKEKQANGGFAWDANAKQYKNVYTVDDLGKPLQFIYDLIFTDKTFDQKTHGMTWGDIGNAMLEGKIFTRFAETPQAGPISALTYNKKIAAGTVQGKPIDISTVQTPAAAGGHAMFALGVDGYVMFKQEQDKGDKHNMNSVLFGKFLGQGPMLAYYPARGYYHMAPRAEMYDLYPMGWDLSLSYWKMGQTMSASEWTYGGIEPKYDDKEARQSIDKRWQDYMDKTGTGLIEAVATDKAKAADVAKQMVDARDALVKDYYATKK